MRMFTLTVMVQTIMFYRCNNVLSRSAGKRDIGSYSCVLENQLGAGKSARSAYLDVHYPPQVLYPEV